jgi:hypothetical protein
VVELDIFSEQRREWLRAQLDVAERFGKLSPKRRRTLLALLDESE